LLASPIASTRIGNLADNLQVGFFQEPVRYEASPRFKIVDYHD
jgi:hypothetical protein